MAETAVDIYSDAFATRGRHELDSDPVVLVAPGVRAVALIRVLVTDDSGYDRLVAEVGNARRGVVMVFEQARRCSEFLRQEPGWTEGHSELAMVLRDIQQATGPALPTGLSLRPVTMVTAKAEDGAQLNDVVRVAIESDLSITDSVDEVARFIGTLPSSVRLFAAIDESGAVRATAACHLFGDYAEVFFVNTEPAWRRRGIGRAMTAAALRDAARLGARSAFLHATEYGRSVLQAPRFRGSWVAHPVRVLRVGRSRRSSSSRTCAGLSTV